MLTMAIIKRGILIERKSLFLNQLKASSEWTLYAAPLN